MSVSLNSYNNGDTNYVSKLNSDMSSIANALNSILSALTGAGSAVSVGSLINGLFQGHTTLLGTTSYPFSLSGTNLTIGSGYAYDSVLNMVVGGSGAVLAFAGQTAGTYYVHLDVSGTPSFNATSTGAIYSVVWTGTAFGTVTLVAKQFMDSLDENNLLTSTALAQSFTTLLARLEYDEALLVRYATVNVPSTSAPGNFTIAHGLGKVPKMVNIAMTSPGGIWFQSTIADATNVFLAASSNGLTAKLQIAY